MAVGFKNGRPTFNSEGIPSGCLDTRTTNCIAGGGLNGNLCAREYRMTFTGWEQGTAGANCDRCGDLPTSFEVEFLSSSGAFCYWGVEFPAVAYCTLNGSLLTGAMLRMAGHPLGITAVAYLGNYQAFTLVGEPSIADTAANCDVPFTLVKGLEFDRCISPTVFIEPLGL